MSYDQKKNKEKIISFAYREKGINWTSLKLKRFALQKTLIRGKKRHITDWERLFANHIANKGLIWRIHKEFSKLSHKKRTNGPLGSSGKSVEEKCLSMAL